MRQFSPTTNLMLACLAALGLCASLGLPWYAPSQASVDADAGSIGDVHGPLESAFDDLVDVFTTPAGIVTGADALDRGQTALTILAAATIVLSLLLAVGLLRSVAREGLRIVPLATCGVVLLNAVDHPAAGLELRWGLLASAAIAGFMASCAWSGSLMPEPRPRPAAYVPPAPPT